MDLFTQSTTAIEERDLVFFENLTKEQINECCNGIYKAAKEGWTDVYPIYQSKFDFWSWVIKNCFTVYGDPDTAWKLMAICPDKFKKQCVERVRDYPFDMDQSRRFVEEFKEWLTPDDVDEVAQYKGRDRVISMNELPEGVKRNFIQRQEARTSYACCII
jgi:hypothetical protein